MSDPIVPTTTNVHSQVPPVVPTDASSATSVKPTGTSTCASYQNNPYFQLITWKDPVATGKVVAGILAGLVVLRFGNPINWFFHFAYLGLIGMYWKREKLF